MKRMYNIEFILDNYHEWKGEKDEFKKYVLDKAKELSKKDGQFVLKGDMTIKDIVKNEEILFNFEDGAFSGRCIIYSNDYNIHTQKTREKSKILIKITVPVL